MSCILRVSGEHLDVDALLSKFSLKPDRIWHPGEPVFQTKPNGRLHNHSGITFLASDADFGEFDKQLEDATGFLQEFRDQISLMAVFEGIDDATLDFGIELRDAFVHSDILTPRFLKAAANAGIKVELSHYPASTV